jgi:hypothetical protein
MYSGMTKRSRRSGDESHYTDGVLPPVTWTEAAEEHIARHRVRPEEVEDVLYGRPRLMAPGRGGTTLVFGTSASGRYLLVVVGRAPDDGISVVTARDMTTEEKRAFRRKGQ